MKKFVVYFGGSFAPPHRGHDEMLCHLLALPEVEQVRLVPTFQNPFKAGESGLTPALKRQAVELWFESLKVRSISGFQKLKIEWIEFESEQVSYTVETLAKLQSMESSPKNWVLCTGDDCLPDLHKWKNVQGLLAGLSEFWVFPRVYPKGSDLQSHSLNAIAEELRGHCVWRLMAKEVPAVSSTELRELLAARSPRTESVHDALGQHGLSRSPSDLVIPELEQLLFPR